MLINGSGCCSFKESNNARETVPIHMAVNTQSNNARKAVLFMVIFSGVCQTRSEWNNPRDTVHYIFKMEDIHKVNK